MRKRRKKPDNVALARNRGMSPVDVRKVERLVYEHQTFLLEKYDDFQSK